jgi:hypothetical protein
MLLGSFEQMGSGVILSISLYLLSWYIDGNMSIASPAISVLGTHGLLNSDSR